MKMRQFWIFLIPVLAVLAPPHKIAASALPEGKKACTKKDVNRLSQTLYKYHLGDKLAQFVRHSSHRSHSSHQSHTSHTSGSYGSSSDDSLGFTTSPSRVFTPSSNSLSPSAVAQDTDLSQYAVKTTNADANLRIEPRADASIIGIIAKSQTVYVKETKDKWSRVYIQFNQMILVGWVNNSLLD